MLQTLSSTLYMTFGVSFDIGGQERGIAMKFLKKSRILYLTIVASVMIAPFLNASPALGKASAFFTYQLKPGVIVSGVAMTYMPIGKAYGIRYLVSNVGQSGPENFNLKLFSDGALVSYRGANRTGF